MGNCQATDAAAVVLQHPGGRVERLYWPTTAGEVMKTNPGHHVALVTLCVAEESNHHGGSGGGGGIVRFTRVRLLKPKDTLLLGQAYRLVTSQEVTKALRARKHEKMKRAQSELVKKQQQVQQQQRLQGTRDDRHIDAERRIDQGSKQEGDRQKSAPAAARARQWRPSLQSISEAGS